MNAEKCMELKNEIVDAEMILIGLGERYDQSAASAENEILPYVLQEEKATWLLPLIYANRGSDDLDGKQREMETLAKALKGKNYFVMSKTQTPMAENVEWREGRFVAPCGSIIKKQCGEVCEESQVDFLSGEEIRILEKAVKLFWIEIDKSEDSESGEDALPEEVRMAMKLIKKREQMKQSARKLIHAAKECLGKCPHCGSERVLNVLQGKKYDQRGYQKDWERYTKWLAGSMNRKLLILEIGNDETLPELIQKPFDKIRELNRKSKLCKIDEIDENLIECLQKL